MTGEVELGRRAAGVMEYVYEAHDHICTGSLLRNLPWRKEWQVFLSRESPWTEEPGRLQSMGTQRVGHD